MINFITYKIKGFPFQFDLGQKERTVYTSQISVAESASYTNKMWLIENKFSHHLLVLCSKQVKPYFKVKMHI